MIEVISLTFSSFIFSYRSRRRHRANPPLQAPISQNVYRPVATGEEDLSDVQNGYFETLWTSNRQEKVQKRTR